MREKIYFGDVDLIDTRSGKIRQLRGIIFKPSDADNGDKFLRDVPKAERPYMRVKRLCTDSARIIGETI